MMKKLLFSVLLLGFAVTVFGQKSSEATRKSPKKVDGPCVVIELEANAKNVEDVLKQKFKKQKTKSEKGFVAVKEQIIPFISSNTMDLYYRVDKKKDNRCEVVFFASKGYDNFVSSQEEPELINNVKKVLDDMVAEVRSYELQLAIDTQMKVLEKATKQQEDLVKDGENLVKEQEKLEKEIEQNKADQDQNKKDQEDQAKTIEGEKKLLDELQKQLDQVK